MNTIGTTLVAVQSKQMWQSKTFWVNAIVGLIALLTELQSVLPAFADILTLPESFGRWLLLALAVANIVLRRISDQPARFRPSNDAVAVPKA